MISSSIVVADAIRRSALRQVLKIPGARVVFVSPHQRIPLAQMVCVLTAFAVSVINPILALSMGAALFGLPHVLFGIRHLGVRRTLHPVSRAMVVVGIALGLALLLGAGRWAMQGLTITFSISIGAEVVSTKIPAGRRLLLLIVLAVLATLALRFYGLFLVAVTHLHAISSIAFFCVAAHRRGISPLPLMYGAVLATVAILGGSADSLSRALPWDSSLAPDSVVDLLGAPFQSLSGAFLQRSLVLYSFGQSLHYMVWLRLMPEIDRPVPVPWSFRQALKALRCDFGALTPVAIAACIVVPAAMLVGGHPARDAYFAIVYFHIGLEAAGLTRTVLAEV